MKKISLVLSVCMLLAMAAESLAVDFKVKGQWVMNFDMGQGGNFTGGNGRTGFNASEDEFNAQQRVRLLLEAVVSESLSGTVYFEMGNQRWGRGAQGAALGADGTVVELKNAYIDWVIPQSPVKLRMGIQHIALPGFSNASQVLSADMPAVVATWRINDAVSLTGMWLRWWNDNYTGNAQGQGAGFMDNTDLWGLLLPITLDGLRLTPWAVYGALGPNTQRNDKNTNPYLPSGTSYYQSGLYPLYGSARNARLTEYGSMAWAGLSAELTLFEPWRVAWDFTYGAVIRDDASSSRAGWLTSLLVEYKMDWGTPGVVAWFGSGDDDSMGNGSERLPYTNLDDGGTGSFDTLAFNGGRANTFRDSLIGHSLSGTWGVGLRVSGISPVENVTITPRINYIGGTNDPALVKKTRSVHANFAANADVLGKEGLYLTRNDSAVSLGVNTEWALYDNFKVYFDVGYIALCLDKDNAVWGGSPMNGKSDTVSNAWNANVVLVYSF